MDGHDTTTHEMLIAAIKHNAMSLGMSNADVVEACFAAMQRVMCHITDARTPQQVIDSLKQLKDILNASLDASILKYTQTEGNA